MSRSPRGAYDALAAPLCCGDEMVETRDPAFWWICVWCSRSEERDAPERQRIEALYPPSIRAAIAKRRTASMGPR